MKHILPVSIGLVLALASPPALAQAADPAVSTVQGLQTSLVGIMRAGGGAGQTGRSKMVAPAIDRAFDIPLMTRLAVGPAWTGFSASDQAALVAAFRALTIAQHAKNFDGYSGEKFNVIGAETRGADKLVRTSLVSPGGSSEALHYRLRQSGGSWKIIDVYFRNAISQLATRRSDFARVIKTGGAPALVAHLNRLAARPT